MPGDDYTRSRSRKQWTDRTEGVLKNIIDKLWESTTVPSTLINIPDWVPQGFLLTANVNEFDLVKDVAHTLTVWLTAVSIGSWAGTVNLISSHNLCSGGSVSLESSSLVLDSENPTRGTRLTISIPSDCPAGSYRVTIVGTGDSITRDVTITIHVGVPGEPPEGDKCTTDQYCIDKYGSGYRCVDGQCLKICGIAEQSNCNDDECAPGQKCVWNASKLACFCQDKDFQLICISSIQLYKSTPGTVKGSLSLISKNGFAGTVSVMIQDICQPECMKCAYPLLRYGSQSGNIIPVPLGAGETKNLDLEITAIGGGCPTETTYHLEITAQGGGKTHQCVVNVEVKGYSGGGLGYFRFSHSGGSVGSVIKVEFFLDAARTQKFAEHIFTTGSDKRSDCFFYNMPSQNQYWWKATKLSPLGEAGTIYFYHCYNNICYENNWGFCSGGTGWQSEQIGGIWYFVWPSQCSCGGSPCTNPTCQCTQECGACPEA
mgnify:FL=1